MVTTRIHAGNYAHDNSPAALAVRRLRRIEEWLRGDCIPEALADRKWRAMYGAVNAALALAEDIHASTTKH